MPYPLSKRAILPKKKVGRKRKLVGKNWLKKICLKKNLIEWKKLADKKIWPKKKFDRKKNLAEKNHSGKCIYEKSTKI